MTTATSPLLYAPYYSCFIPPLKPELWDQVHNTITLKFSPFQIALECADIRIHWPDPEFYLLNGPDLLKALAYSYKVNTAHLSCP